MGEGKTKPPSLEEFATIVLGSNYRFNRKILELMNAAKPLIIAYSGRMREHMPNFESPYDVRHVSLKEYVESATPKYFDPTSIQKSRGKRKQKRY